MYTSDIYCESKLKLFEIYWSEQDHKLGNMGGNSHVSDLPHLFQVFSFWLSYNSFIFGQ